MFLSNNCVFSWCICFSFIVLRFSTILHLYITWILSIFVSDFNEWICIWFQWVNADCMQQTTYFRDKINWCHYGIWMSVTSFYFSDNYYVVTLQWIFTSPYLSYLHYKCQGQRSDLYLCIALFGLFFSRIAKHVS